MSFLNGVIDKQNIDDNSNNINFNNRSLSPGPDDDLPF